METNVFNFDAYLSELSWEERIAKKIRVEYSDSDDYLYIKIYFPATIDEFTAQFAFYEFSGNKIVTPLQVTEEGKENMVSLSISQDFLNQSKLSIHYGHIPDGMLKVLRFSLSK